MRYVGCAEQARRDRLRTAKAKIAGTQDAIVSECVESCFTIKECEVQSTLLYVAMFNKSIRSECHDCGACDEFVAVWQHRLLH